MLQYPITFACFVSVAVMLIAGWLCAFFITKPVVLRLPFRIPLIVGLALWPFVVLSAKADASDELHEITHWEQQLQFLCRFFGFVGLLLWLVLYFLVLPFVWNPFRRAWETEAFVAEGFSEDAARQRLRDFPYLLWL